jgi:hypothetical protein
MKVLFATEPGNVSPWYQDFVAALAGEFEVLVWPPASPLLPQVQDAIAVVNMGPFFEGGFQPPAVATVTHLRHIVDPHLTRALETVTFAHLAGLILIRPFPFQRGGAPDIHEFQREKLRGFRRSGRRLGSRGRPGVGC